LHLINAVRPELADSLRDLYQASYFRTSERAFRRRARLGGQRPPAGTWGLDLRRGLARSERVRPISAAIMERLNALGIRQIAGRGYGAYLLIGATLQLGSDLRAGLIRESRKDHGFMELIEGDLDREAPICLIDDLLSGGNSAVQAASLLRQEGYRPSHLLVVYRFGWNNGAAKVRRFGLEPGWLGTLER